MKTPIECTCNPDAHGRIISINTQLLRRVRKDSLERAQRWEKEGNPDVAVCARWNAWQCLQRLRELKSNFDNRHKKSVYTKYTDYLRHCKGCPEPGK